MLSIFSNKNILRVVFFMFFKINDSLESFVPKIPDYRKTPKNRFIEKTVKNISPEAGKIIEKANNALDSFENLNESVENLHPVNIVGRTILKSFTDIHDIKKKLKKGDHIKVQRVGYYHHGIYDGSGSVYEYNEGVIRLVSLENFSDGDMIEIVTDEPTNRTGSEIVRRAQRRLGETNYNLIFNNCGHFATWCRIGAD